MWTAAAQESPWGLPSVDDVYRARAGLIFPDPELEVKSSAVPRVDGRDKKKY